MDNVPTRDDLDATDEAPCEGRSAVPHLAPEEFLRWGRLLTIRERYEQGYGPEPGLGEDFEGWSEEGAWPEK
ncbi:MAG: hypothetical protein AMXMBFR53_38900 [Gemmatimonadota bacterium]